MTDGILINRVYIKINKDKFAEKYVILKAEFADYTSRKSAVEVLAKYPFVCAIKYDFKPGVFYAMCLKDPSIPEATERMNSLTLDEEPVHEVPIDSLPRHLQIELLSIGLGRADPGEQEEGHYSNMEGALFMFDALKVKDDHVEALNIKYRPPRALEQFGDVAVDFRATSFYDWDLHKYMKFRNKRPEDYVKYVTTEQGNMKMLTGSPKKNQKMFILHGYRNRKASIPFYDVGSVASLDSSKMGMLASSHRDLHSVYGDIIEEFGFVRTDLFDKMHISKKKGHDDRFEKYLFNLVQTKTFKIYDYLKNEDSKQIIEGFVDDVKTIYGIDIETEEELDPSILNIAIIQKSYRDENHAHYSDKVVQHLAVDSIKKKYEGDYPEITSKRGRERRNTIAMTLLNAIIKEDVQKRNQSFYAWVQDELIQKSDGHDWYYADRVRIKNPDENKKMEATFSPKMAVMKLSADGSTEYWLYDRDEVPDGWMKIAYSMFKQGDANIRGIVSDGESIYRFCDTDAVMIPEVERTRQILHDNPEYVNKKGKLVKSSEGVRDGENREEQLKACTDVRGGITGDGDLLYFVGTRGDGMNTGIHWAANLHRAELVDGFEPLPEYQLELMLAPFVRYLGMTVIPYPFKYLHEYEHMYGLEDYIPESDEDEDDGSGEKVKQMSIYDFIE